MKNPQTNFCAAFVSASKPASLRFTSIPITPGHETSGRDLLGTSLLNGKTRLSLDSRATRLRCRVSLSVANYGKRAGLQTILRFLPGIPSRLTSEPPRDRLRGERVAGSPFSSYKRSDNFRPGTISERDGIASYAPVSNEFGKVSTRRDL
jgi:hypothetical protein